MALRIKFDHIIESSVALPAAPIPNIATLLFEPVADRDESSTVVLGHDDHQVVPVSLKRLRVAVSRLFADFAARGIAPGSTVLLASLPGNNELPVAIMFLALASYGVRVLLPMFIERDALDEWMELAGCSAIISAKSELRGLAHHDREKGVLDALDRSTAQRGVPSLDLGADFSLTATLGSTLWEEGADTELEVSGAIEAAIGRTTPATEALIVTTSGSSGKAKLVVYTHGAYIANASSWQAAGLFARERFGGPGFTPLLAHTMGIRALFNALWTGHPVCLVTPEWFVKKPEIVRYFLMQMRPTHLTGGPALHEMLLELVRVFPDLKESLESSLRTVVSSGAPFDAATAKRLADAFGVTVHNAFGTTENQQTLSTLVDDATLGTMGRPLPGVRIGLERTEGEGVFRLHVSSVFGHARILDGTSGSGAPSDFCATGDLVRLDERGGLHHVGRESGDFIKDGFGVKVPLSALARNFRRLLERVEHVEWFAIKNGPGLGALLFARHPGVREGVVADDHILRKYASLASELNGQLLGELEPFEFRHQSVARLVIVNGEVPRTGKGTISRARIEQDHARAIEALVDPLASASFVAAVNQTALEPHDYTRCHNPRVGWALHALGIDYSYHRAKKDSLFTMQSDKEIEILDFVGGYGANLLGHNDPRLKQTMLDFLVRDEVAISDQGSIQRQVGALAQELGAAIGRATGRDYYVLFGNSGSEAVEIALHHALLEWRIGLEEVLEREAQKCAAAAGDLAARVLAHNRDAIARAKVAVITAKGSFHGHSTGARGMLGRDKSRNRFSNLLALDRIAIDERQHDWRQRLDEEMSRHCITLQRVVVESGVARITEREVSTVIAAVVEPVIGEGGVREVDPAFLRALAERPFPLIADEIQCGLGRTGQVPASGDVPADYYILSKSLGGNLEKISAVLIDRRRYREEHSEHYVSTFAGGGLAAAVARTALRVMREDDVSGRAARIGQKLGAMLHGLQARYPDVIASVTGRGLMFGVELADFASMPGVFLRVLGERELAGHFCSAYLLRKHRVRVFPTMSAPNTLRLEPSAYVTDEEIAWLERALADLADTLRRRSSYDLLSLLMDDDRFTDRKGFVPEGPRITTGTEPPAPGARRVAFIGHFARVADELRQIEGDLVRASDTGLRLLFTRLSLLMDEKPFVGFSKNLFDGRVHFTFVALPVDSAELEKRHRQGKRRAIVAKIQEAVDLAHRLGAEVVSLGGYTSILSTNGLALVEPEGTRIITGNTLTAAAGVEALLTAIGAPSTLGRKLTLGVVGVAGNIGSVVANALVGRGELFDRAVLVTRQGARLGGPFLDGLEQTAKRSGVELVTTSEMGALVECDVMCVATNTNDPIVFPHHVSRDKVVTITDLSVPPAVSRAVRSMSNVRHLQFSSFVTLAADPTLVVSSHTPPGTAFCCAAEAMLCGLERVEFPLRGAVSLHAMREVTRLAHQHGMLTRVGAIASYRTGD